MRHCVRDMGGCVLSGVIKGDLSRVWEGKLEGCLYSTWVLEGGPSAMMALGVFHWLARLWQYS